MLVNLMPLTRSWGKHDELIGNWSRRTSSLERVAGAQRFLAGERWYYNLYFQVNRFLVNQCMGKVNIPSSKSFVDRRAKFVFDLTHLRAGAPDLRLMVTFKIKLAACTKEKISTFSWTKFSKRNRYQRDVHLDKCVWRGGLRGFSKAEAAESGSGQQAWWKKNKESCRSFWEKLSFPCFIKISTWWNKEQGQEW